MSMKSSPYALFAMLAVTLIVPALAAEMTDAELVANAVSAAPVAVGKDATVVNIDSQMQMKTLQEGTNGFTCMPDNLASPTNDPICVDAGGMAWLTAYSEKKPPPAGVGFGYMLQGESAPNNLDPYATEPAAGHGWMVDGPHVMIFNVNAEMLAAYPQDEHPDHTKPYVMWPNTPYAHLMIPVH